MWLNYICKISIVTESILEQQLLYAAGSTIGIMNCIIF